MPAPPNDLCANALVVAALPYTDTQDIFGATVSAGDPVNSANGAVAAHNIWYVWTAPSNMSVVADLQGSQKFSLGPSTGVSFLVMGVFTGSCGGAWTEIASKADSYTNFFGRARVQFNAVSGTTYYFNVGTKSNATIGVNDPSNLVFNLFVDPGAPANDLCTNAILVGALPWTDTARNIMGSTLSVDDPIETLVWGQQLDQSAWYKLVPAASGTITISSVGSDFMPVLAVWGTGACGSLSNELAGDQGNIAPDTSISFAATAGQPYYIEVGFVDGAYAASRLTLTITTSAVTPPPDPPINLTATPNDVVDGVTLAWQAPASGTPPDAYEIQRCEGVGCNTFVTVGTTAALSFSQTYLDPLATYRYQVRSTTVSFGNSGYTTPVSVVIGAPVPRPCSPTVGRFRQDLGGCIGSAGTWGSAALMARQNQGLIFGFNPVILSGTLGTLTDDGSIPLLATIVWAFVGIASSFARRSDGVHSPGVALLGVPTFNGQPVSYTTAFSGAQTPDSLLTPACAGGSTDLATFNAPDAQGTITPGYRAIEQGILNVAPDSQLFIGGSDALIGGPYYSAGYFLRSPLTNLPWTRAEIFSTIFGWRAGWDGGPVTGSPFPDDSTYITPDLQLDRLIVSVHWVLPCTTVTTVVASGICGSASSVVQLLITGTTFTASTTVTVILPDGSQPAVTILSLTPTQIVASFLAPICGTYAVYVNAALGFATLSIPTTGCPDTLPLPSVSARPGCVGGLPV